MKGEKDMKSIKHYDDFTNVLNQMNNDDLYKAELIFKEFIKEYKEKLN